MQASPATRRWLFGPATDLLLGCGGLHLLLVLLFAVPVVQRGVDPWLVLGAGLISHLTNTPHYGATLLRVYEQRSERRRFALFSVWITLALALLFVAGLHHALLGSLLITVYATWSPWHFSGQNYGLSLMLMRRRGVDVDLPTKRLLYASFLLSFALTALLLHTEAGDIALAPVPAAISGKYRFLSLGLPDAFSRALFPLLGTAYLAVIGVAGARLSRHGNARDLAPAALLIFTQLMWFSFPALLRYMDAFTTSNIAFGAFGVSIAHSVQYLWVTSYFATNSARGERVPAFLARTLLAGAAVVVFPALVFAPELLGTVPFNAGLGILLFSVVNLHHFLLDGAIWKLRDGPVARVLLRSPEEAAADAPTAAAVSHGPWRTAFFAAGALAFGVAIFYAFEVEFGINRALRSSDLPRVEAAVQHLRWIGRDDYRIHRQLADALARETWREALANDTAGDEVDFSAAIHHYEESLRIYESAAAWLGLGNVEYTRGDYAAARRAYESALRLNPRHFRALNRLGELWLARGDLQRARASLERAAALAPRDARIHTALERLAEAERMGG